MAEKTNSIQQRFRQFQEKYTAELPQKLATVMETWQSIFESDSAIDSRMFDFRRQIHSIAGSAGSFGYTRLSGQALQLETFLNKLAENTLPNSHEQDFINDQLTQLRLLAEHGPDVSAEHKFQNNPAATGNTTNKTHTIYIIDDNEFIGKEAASQLEQYGYTTVVFTNIQEAETAIQNHPPSAMVVDVDFPEGRLAGPSFVQRLNSMNSAPIPIIFISARNDWQARLAAVRAGGAAYVTKPFDTIALVDHLDHLLDVKTQQPYRILIVEDDAILAEHYANVLQAHDMHTHVVTDSAKILDALQEVKPELVLMDIYMPGVSGIETATVIRQTEAYLNIPIVYLSTESGLNQQLEALRLGGDDFLQKPIQDDHLAEAVKIRAERFRTLGALMVRDSLTGLLNHIALKLELEGAIAQAVRNKSPLTFAMIDIDHFKQVNDVHGHPVGDRVIKSLARLLQRRLRQSDVIGRYGGEEFAVILPDTAPAEAKKVLDELRLDFANTHHSGDTGEFSASFSAGISSVPEYTHIDALICAADDALYKAKHAGRNQIVVDTISP